MRTELESPVVSIVLLWDQKNTDEELELPFLSSESYLSCMFVVEK